MAVTKAASSSYTQLAYIPEVTAGVTPTTGKGVNLRMTGESLSQEVSKEVSAELSSTRQTASMYLTDAQVQGGVNFELSSGEYDPFIEALLMDTWSTFGTNGVLSAGTATVDAAAKTITLTTAANGLEVGAYFSLSGTAIEQGNKGPHRVTAIDSTRKILTVATTTLKDQTVASASVYHGKLTNGVTSRSFTLEKRFTDVDQTFLYRGMQVSKCNFAFEPRTALTGSFDFIGTTSENATGLQLGDKTPYVESKTGKIIDSVVGMKDVLFDGQLVTDNLGIGVTKISLDYDNALRGLEALGVLGNAAVAAGNITCGGSMEIYFSNGQIWDAILKQQRFRIEFAVYDADGHGYAFILPSVEFASTSINASQKDEDIIQTVEFTALMHPELKKTLIINRF